VGLRTLATDMLFFRAEVMGGESPSGNSLVSFATMTALVTNAGGESPCGNSVVSFAKMTTLVTNAGGESPYGNPLVYFATMTTLVTNADTPHGSSPNGREICEVRGRILAKAPRLRGASIC
jgi:hypothetical protein